MDKSSSLQFFLLVPAKIQAKLVRYLDGGSFLAPASNTLHYPFGNWGNLALALINCSNVGSSAGKRAALFFIFAN